ncbi:hypothetical protein [Holdemania massiliensis]|uniref:hypothetical protein n=1 Tax=Holdemania massiliensis TaxID=1468449 RepID=UPI001F055DFA|nr:hypothetical protein [Holdemania massiliensis]MCH1940527.1 hypothetical protein [Holdemania massiliensis]
MVATLADLLDSRREDSCTIQRIQPEVAGALDRNEQYVDVKKGVRCHLSVKTMSVPDGVGRYQVVNVFQIFTRPEVEIKQGDRLIVIKQGLTYVLTAGKAIRYGSHLEVTCQEVTDL